MTIPKSYILLFIVILIGVIIILSRGCKNDAAPTAKTIDSLKWVISTDSTQYVARASLADNTIKGLTLDLDTTKHALDSIRKQFNVQGKQILATNKRLRDAFNNKDTAQIVDRCDSLSHAIDSIAQVEWAKDREIDRQQILNEQLRYTDSLALLDARQQIDKTRHAYSVLTQNYEIQRQQDVKALRRGKKGKWLAGIIGAGIAETIRGFVSIFKK